MSTSQASSSLSDSNAMFTWFPKLPIELRFAIWDLATPGPRLITLQRKEGAFWISCTGSASCARQVLPVLQVNQEAREYVLRRYESSFRNHLGYKEICFDFSRDALHLDNFQVFEQFTQACHPVSRSEMQKLKILVLEGATSEIYYKEIIASIAKQFGGLQHLLLIRSLPSPRWNFQWLPVNLTTPQREAAFKHDFQEAWAKERLKKKSTAAQKVPEINFFNKKEFRNWVDTKARFGSDLCYCQSLIIARGFIGFDPQRIASE